MNADIAAYVPVLVDSFVNATIGKVVEKSSDAISNLLKRFRAWSDRRHHAKLVDQALSSGDREYLLSLVERWLDEDQEAVKMAEGTPSIMMSVHSRISESSGFLDQRTMTAGGDQYSATVNSGPVAQGPGARAIQHVHRSDTAP